MIWRSRLLHTGVMHIMPSLRIQAALSQAGEKTLRLLERRNQTFPQRCFQRRCSSIRHAITHYANSPRFPKWECSCLASTRTLSQSLSKLPTFLLQKRHFSATAGHPCPHPDLIQESTEMSCTLHAMKCFLGQEKQQH